ncbi:type I-C CRISPR-associated protein Cas8c/Csd1 [uncultured Prevotella sp.]|uniref:type I-C CRISPR-associated protein Cas8c/Csd1 n=1 Tax=uncultured Prevotella sp. TaxID=159272 RepID=UPI0026302DF4|nr:type I-C CRISPR-associated protein Cas8c/Csd1 [uncultured Prevotella sp.]
MILKALYDYYNRCNNLPASGMEEKEIGFVIVISKEGNFVRFEDCRIDNKQARTYLVKKHVGRSSAVVANYLYDNSAYVLGYAENEKAKKDADEQTKKRSDKENACLEAFKEKVLSIYKIYPESNDLAAISKFYQQSKEEILSCVSQDNLWEDIKKNLSKKYSTFSFRIDGDLKIVAEKKELLQLEDSEDDNKGNALCLITGNKETTVDTTTATMIPGSQATAKLVAFQVNSGYDSYGKKKCGNAPISKNAEFAYTTALNAMLQKGSHNKFSVGNRTFVFWASSNAEAAEQAEENLFNLLGFTEEEQDGPNAKINQVRKVFTSIYSGTIKTSLDDRFYILGLAPNSARIAVVYWSECSLKEFAGTILHHFNDMEIIDTRKEGKPYMGIKDMLAAVTLNGKQSEATPNLPEAVVKSIFQGTPYPFTLFSACIRRIRAESGNKDKNAIRIARMAIIKAYLNRINDNNKKIDTMLDKSNTNQGYLCGRLFAVLDKIQEDANRISSIRERYMNAASATPASVFATILNLSSHHMEKLANENRRIFYEKIKQEIIDKIPATGFPAHLDLQDQGRFFIGYYHQRQDFFTKKEN